MFWWIDIALQKQNLTKLFHQTRFSWMFILNLEAVVQMCSVKKLFLEFSQISQENTCARVSFLIKMQAYACNFIKKETLAQVFSCEICEISKNIFFHRTPLVAVSANLPKGGNFWYFFILLDLLLSQILLWRNGFVM